MLAMSEIGKRILAELEHQEKPIQALATHLKISRSAVSQWGTKTGPKWENLAKAATFLKKDINYFLTPADANSEDRGSPPRRREEKSQMQRLRFLDKVARVPDELLPLANALLDQLLSGGEPDPLPPQKARKA